MRITCLGTNMSEPRIIVGYKASILKAVESWHCFKEL